MTSTLFEGHRYVRIINCNFVFGFLSTLVERCVAAAHLKKDKHSMVCVTDVYLRAN